MALPPWAAVMTQAPAATVWTVDSDTVHTCGVSDVNDTTSAGSGAADADKLTKAPAVVSAGGVKVIVCPACPAVT